MIKYIAPPSDEAFQKCLETSSSLGSVKYIEPSSDEVVKAWYKLIPLGKDNDTPCQHEYLPDEDGVVYTCGEMEERYLDVSTGKVYCNHHNPYL